jgi:hypothetical protein
VGIEQSIKTLLKDPTFFESLALIIPIHSNQKKVKYIAELHFNEESKVIILGNC